MSNGQKKIHAATELLEPLYRQMRRKCDPIGMSNSEYLRMLVYQDLKHDGFLDPRTSEIYNPPSK